LTEETVNTHEVCLFVRPVDEADRSRRSVVEVPRINVGVDEIRSRSDRRHDPDDRDHCQCTTSAQSSPQRMYYHHISAFIQHRFACSTYTYKPENCSRSL